MRKHAVLQRIENDRPIGKEESFFLTCQQALLLALRDCGLLTEAQYQRAAETLTPQLRAKGEPQP